MVKSALSLPVVFFNTEYNTEGMKEKIEVVALLICVTLNINCFLFSHHHSFYKSW